jgi:hypothetical protein
LFAFLELPQLHTYLFQSVDSFLDAFRLHEILILDGPLLGLLESTHPIQSGRVELRLKLDLVEELLCLLLRLTAWHVEGLAKHRKSNQTNLQME